MTACVNKKSKRVAAVVTASLVGALSIGAPAVALATDTSIDLLATDANAFAKGTVSYKYGMEAGADFTYTGYDQGLVPSKVEVYNGDTEFPELRPLDSELKADTSYYWYVKVDTDKTEAAVNVGGIKVQYKNAKGKLVTLTGESVKTDGKFVRPTSEGTYAVIVATTDANGAMSTTAGSVVSVADTFTITGQSLDGAKLYEGDDLSDDTFAYDGLMASNRVSNYKKNIGLQLEDVALKNGEDGDYTVSFYEKGSTSALKDSDTFQTGKTYVAKIMGFNRFQGQEIEREFTYGKLDLSNADIVTKVFTSATPSKDSSFGDILGSLNGVSQFGGSDGQINPAFTDKGNADEIVVTFVSGPEGSGIADGNGVYTFKLSAKTNAIHVTGETTVEVHKANFEATVDFSAMGDFSKEKGKYVVDLSDDKPNYIDLSDIVVKYTDGKEKNIDIDDCKVVVLNAAGEEVSADSLKTPGDYTVKVVCDTEDESGKTIYAIYGEGSAKVSVAYTVDRKADVFFSYNKKNVSLSTSDEYNGSDFSKAFSFKVTAGSKQLVEGTDYDVIIEKTQKDGKKVVVDSVVDAGEYTITVDGKTFSNDEKFGFTVTPVTFTDSVNVQSDNYDKSSLKIAEILKAQEVENNVAKTVRYLAQTGNAIVPTFTYVRNNATLTVPADAYEVEYRDTDNKVVDLKDAGVYTARIVSKSEASNYEIDFKFTNLKVSEAKVFSDVHTSDWFYKPVSRPRSSPT